MAKLSVNEIKELKKQIDEMNSAEISGAEQVKKAREDVKKINEQIYKLTLGLKSANEEETKGIKAAIAAHKEKKGEIQMGLTMLNEVDSTYDSHLSKIKKINENKRKSISHFVDEKKLQEQALIIQQSQNKGYSRSAEIMTEILDVSLSTLDVNNRAKLLAFDEESQLEAIRNAKSDIRDLEDEGTEEAKKQVKILKAQVSMAEQQVVAVGKLAKKAQAAKAASDKLKESSMGILDNIEGSWMMMKEFTKAALANPVVAIAAAGVLAGKAIEMMVNFAATFRDNMGASLNQSKSLAGSMALAKAESMALGYEVGQIANTLVNEFGDMSMVSEATVMQLGRMEKILGVSPEHSAKLLSSMMKVGGQSEEIALNNLKSTSALAEANGIPVGKLFEDMASASEEMAAYGGENLDNMKRAAIEARKMGVTLATTLKITDKLLDFEGSIASEMEASLMIGKQLNFNRARQLALEGDVAGAAKDVVAQIGGQAEFAKMNVLQRRALADSIGVSVEEMSKLASGKVEFKQPKKTAEEELLSANQILQGTMMNLSDKIPLLTGAIFGLTAVMVGNMLKDGLGGLKNMIPGGKGKNITKSAAKTGLTKSGKFDMRTNKGKALAAQAKKKAVKKASLKAGAKGLGKAALKKIPIIGALGGLAFGASRLMKGDISGALMEVASGAASIVPGIGTAASVALDAALMAKDVSAASKDSSEVVGEQTEALSDGQELRETTANLQDESEGDVFRRMLEIQGITQEQQKTYQEQSMLLLQQIIDANNQTGTKVENLTKE